MPRYLKKTCLTLPGLVLVARRLALRDDRLLKLTFIRFDFPTRDRLLQGVTDLPRSPRLVNREKQDGDAIRSELRNRLLAAAIVDLDLEIELDTSTLLCGGVTLHVEMESMKSLMWPVGEPRAILYDDASSGFFGMGRLGERLRIC
jgi:hypothetical protein